MSIRRNVRTWLSRGILAVLAVGGLLATSGSPGYGAWPVHPVELPGRYVDWSQQEVPFGSHSYYHAPWRAYMDTWDASQLLGSLGVVFNVAPEEADPTARLLAEAGIVTARVEIGWGMLDYEDTGRLRPQQEREMRMVLGALRKHGIRPLILLNSHSGLPAPGRSWEAELQKPAKAGDRVLQLSAGEKIRPKYTGLKGIAQFMYPVITSYDVSNGRAELSAPLSESLPAGKLELAELRYQPFSGERLADGTTNAASKETVDGWMRYVRTVTGFVKNVMATDDEADAGFDVEVWNELSFGYHFLDINDYYDPPLVYAQELSYSDGSLSEQGAQIILPLTAAYIAKPSSELPGVKVINGFANQRPWDNGTTRWPGQTGFSRHYYTGWDPVSSQIVAANRTLKRDAMIDRLGQPDPKGYIPPHVSAFPERWHYAYQTEYVSRDLQPFPGPWKNHYRYSQPGDGKTAEVWMTESNLYRGQFAKELARKTGVAIGDRRLSALMHRIAAKSTLRNYIFQSHKGVQRIYLYAAKGKDSEFALLPEAYYETLKRAKYRLTPAVRLAAGPQLQALGNLVRQLENGERVEQPRFVDVERIASEDGTLVYRGDGRSVAPDRYLIEDLAVLPYQLSNHRYAVAYYIVTRDVTAVWNPDKGVFDPQRYDKPERMIEVTLSNVAGVGAKVEVYDPLTDTRTKPRVAATTATTLTVQLPVTDAPRLLLIEEDKPQPLIAGAELRMDGDDAILTFVPEVSGEAKISWGPYPWRSGGSFRKITYGDDLLRERTGEQQTSGIGGELPSSKGSYEWTGVIQPDYSEEYSFIVDAASCNVTLWINDRQIIDGCYSGVQGRATLVAGRSYNIKTTYSSPYEQEHHLSLYWASESQQRESVAPAADERQQQRLQVTAGETVVVRIVNLSVGEGVKVSLTSKEGIRAVFPYWDYDVSGVRW
ncbi:hypothetical protein PA598K_04435 [Paenibacillus sp. 598K]|uniref:PA14 domain-containing protein n=1 Tax=Paenibacillus sp. 598K TaxID=1117987 RepID=UPI000FFA1F06|nr:PA14 domain-containing protein [Paenibacillus sp. 598K]GBF75996.1 hypothetical protein PA598K_04435 [Paenibacillus sp. 598K]